jgi:hypothetical protein
MPHLLADLPDISKWLSDHKVDADDSNTANFQVEASRIVKSKLSGVFTPVILHGWDSPANTPGIIRSIAGELIAAYLYRELYAEDVTDVPQYAQTLYNEAIALLQQIQDGLLVVLDDNDVPIATTLSSANLTTGFWPNDSTPGPYFKMDDIFA